MYFSSKQAAAAAHDAILFAWTLWFEIAIQVALSGATAHHLKQVSCDF
jgi:hypothetical protein